MKNKKIKTDPRSARNLSRIVGLVDRRAKDAFIALKAHFPEGKPWPKTSWPEELKKHRVLVLLDKGKKESSLVTLSCGHRGRFLVDSTAGSVGIDLRSGWTAKKDVGYFRFRLTNAASAKKGRFTAMTVCYIVQTGKKDKPFSCEIALSSGIAAEDAKSFAKALIFLQRFAQIVAANMEGKT